MSLTINPIVVSDLALGTNGTQYTVPIPIQPDRVAAIRIYNSTPFTLNLTSIPGVNQVWLSPFNEEIYIVNNTGTDIVSNKNVGQFYFVPFNFYQFGLDTGATFIITNYYVVVTIYEIGDIIPVPIPVSHGQIISVAGSVNPRINELIANQATAGGAANSLSIASPDYIGVNYTLPYFTVLTAVSIDVTNNATQHNFNLSITGCTTSPVTININIPVGSFSWYRTLYWRSASQGNPANLITVAIPAIGSGPGLSLTIWGYGERAT